MTGLNQTHSAKSHPIIVIVKISENIYIISVNILRLILRLHILF